MNSTNNVNFISFLTLVFKRKKQITINFIVISLIVLICFSIFKEQKYKYEINVKIKPISYINFQNNFSFFDEFSINSEPELEVLGSDLDSFNLMRLTPQTIFYHYITIIEKNLENFYSDEKSKFPESELIWNQRGIIYNFDIFLYGDNEIELTKKVKTLLNKTNNDVKEDLIKYLNILNQSENVKQNSILVNKIEETIEKLNKSENIIRIAQMNLPNKITTKTIILIIALFLSLVFSIIIELIRIDLKNNENKNI